MPEPRVHMTGTPHNAQIAYNQAILHLKQGNFFAAKQLLEEVLRYGPHAPALFNLGVLNHKQGQFQRAIRFFEQALDTDPSHPQAHQALIAAVLMTDDPAIKIKAATRAVLERPYEIKFKEAFAQFVRNHGVANFDADLKRAVSACLAEDHLTHDILVHLWMSLFFSDPDYQSCMKAVASGFDAFVRWIHQDNAAAPLLDAFFIGGLRRLVVPDRRFEKLTLYLRRALFLHADRFNDIVFQTLVRALAHYQESTDYINPIDDSEKILLDELSQNIEGLTDFKNNALMLAQYAMFRPLAHHLRAKDILLCLEHDPVWGLFVRQHIGERLEERNLRADIPLITPIDNAISQAVRAQYEENPYPRWKSLYRASGYYMPHLPSCGESMQILVAGCGTGQEPLWIASAYPKAKILAVDLSLSSLSYGLRQARAHGITNVEFAQADLLCMPGTGYHFDVIISSGVLHHMQDPVQGWRALLACLKPGGLMSVSLYSRLARAAITRARAVIAAHNLCGRTDDIRQFRAHMHDWLDATDRAVIEQSGDYYALSTCRDLLFHEQEHCFFIEEIQRIIRDLGLFFLEFHTSPEVLQMFHAAYPDDPDDRNLDHWHAFEEKNPHIFRGMYRLWCEKPQTSS